MARKPLAIYALTHDEARRRNVATTALKAFINPAQRTEFYGHDQQWSNHMMLGNGFQVMTSLVERVNLKYRAQCIYTGPWLGWKSIDA